MGENVSIDSVLKEAESAVKLSLQEISALIKKDFKSQAENALVAYYDHYHPSVYERTMNLMNNAIDDDIGFDDFNKRKKNTYGGYVHFTSNDMYYYKDGNVEGVLNNFMYGVHGRKTIYTESNPAISIMEDFQRKYRGNYLNGYFISRGFEVN